MFLRIAIGLVFVASSLLKAVSIQSFSMVARDFMNLLGIDFLNPDFVAVAVCIGEGVIGVLAFSRKVYEKVHWLYPAVMAFFTCLTYINLTDIYGGIESCGCFGEIVHLNPVQSHMKNLLLLMMTLASSVMTVRSKSRCEYSAC